MVNILEEVALIPQDEQCCPICKRELRLKYNNIRVMVYKDNSTGGILAHIPLLFCSTCNMYYANDDICKDVKRRAPGMHLQCYPFEKQVNKNCENNTESNSISQEMPKSVSKEAIHKDFSRLIGMHVFSNKNGAGHIVSINESADYVTIHFEKDDINLSFPFPDYFFEVGYNTRNIEINRYIFKQYPTLSYHFYNSNRHRKNIEADSHYTFEDETIRYASIDPVVKKEKELELSKALRAKEKVLYVYKGQLLCSKHKHNIICVKLHVPSKQLNSVPINANYCCDCNRLFLHYNDYRGYQNKYGLLDIRFEDETGCIKNHYSYERVASVLRRAGYKVDERTSLPAFERRRILCNVVANGMLEKWEIIDYLNRRIEFNGANINVNMQNAVDKWEADIEFMHSYDFDKQVEMTATEIRRY